MESSLWSCVNQSPLQGPWYFCCITLWQFGQHSAFKKGGVVTSEGNEGHWAIRKWCPHLKVKQAWDKTVLPLFPPKMTTRLCHHVLFVSPLPLLGFFFPVNLTESLIWSLNLGISEGTVLGHLLFSLVMPSTSMASKKCPHDEEPQMCIFRPDFLLVSSTPLSLPHSLYLSILKTSVISNLAFSNVILSSSPYNDMGFWLTLTPPFTPHP